MRVGGRSIHRNHRAVDGRPKPRGRLDSRLARRAGAAARPLGGTRTAPDRRKRRSPWAGAIESGLVGSPKEGNRRCGLRCDDPHESRASGWTHGRSHHKVPCADPGALERTARARHGGGLRAPGAWMLPCPLPPGASPTRRAVAVVGAWNGPGAPGMHTSAPPSWRNHGEGGDLMGGRT